MVRAAICLAAAWDGNGTYRKIREVAEEMELPLSYTPQVLGMLARSDLAEAKAGREGGYRLTRAPKDISLLEVIEAAEGYLISERCPIRGGPCRWDDVCAVHPTWARASEAIREVLSRTTLEEVAAVDRHLEAGDLVGTPPPEHRGSGHAHARGKKKTRTRTGG